MSWVYERCAGVERSQNDPISRVSPLASAAHGIAGAPVYSARTMSTAYEPLIEAFLIVEQPRQRLGHWTQTLAALDSPMAPALAAIVAYYDPTTDQALINVRYDELALGPKKLEFVVEVALLAEVGLIQPHELSEGERKRFLMERISRCTHQSTYQRSVIGALTELVRKLKENKSVGTLATVAQPLPHQPPPIPTVARKASTTPRGDTEDPVLLVASAKGTRDDIQKVPSSRADLPTEPSPVVNTGEGSDRMKPEPLPLPPLPHRNLVPRRDESGGMYSSRIPAVPMPPAQSVRMAAATIDPPTARRLHARQPEIIYARYLRSGRWVATRIGALSLKGATLMAGAMPRIQDHVDLSLTFGTHGALVRGTVDRVSSHGEARATGASFFNVTFELDDASRRQLVILLTAARTANITIKPPPARSTRRYPVEWPVCLGTSRGAIKADALDVSTDGMFVRPANSLSLDAVVNFSVVLDDSGPPIAGRAKIVRQVSDAEAKTAGLAPGYGLNITEMAQADRMRWLGFLARIERRADKRVLIGASPQRLAELQHALAAVGYAVTGGTDPGALVQLASAETRPADAALIDGGWLETGGTLVETLFSSRNVPCVTLHGDVRRARSAVDKLLQVLT
jgi:hypothetical protein